MAGYAGGNRLWCETANYVPARFDPMAAGKGTDTQRKLRLAASRRSALKRALLR